MHSCILNFVRLVFLQRRRMFHTLTLIIPNVLLALLASLVFLIPSDGGEKMSFIMGLLLATGVSLTVLMDIMPRSSLHISVLMIYIGALRYDSSPSIWWIAYTICGRCQPQVTSLQLECMCLCWYPSVYCYFCSRWFIKMMLESVYRCKLHRPLQYSVVYLA